MSEVSDQMLMAYVDGKLDAASGRRVEQALAGSAELRERARRFRETGAPIHDAFAGMLDEPMPQHLLDFARTAPIGEPPREPATVHRLPEQPRRRGFAASFSRLAAGIAILALAAGGGWLAHARFGEGQRRAAPVVAGFADALQSPLETLPKGAVAVLSPQGGSVTLGSTFIDKSHHYCRQYQLTVGAGRSFKGVACRSAPGGWTVELHTRQAAAAASEPMGPAAKKVEDAYEAGVDEMMAGGLLDPSEERMLLDSCWLAKLPER